MVKRSSFSLSIGVIHTCSLTLYLFACLSPQTCRHLCRLLSSYSILCHAIYPLHWEPVFMQHLYFFILFQDSSIRYCKQLTHSELFISVIYKAGSLTASTITLTTWCYLLLHSEADWVRKLEQVAVLLLYCIKWFPLGINLILVGKQDHQLSRESMGQSCNDQCNDHVQYFKCSTDIQKTLVNKIVARIDFLLHSWENYLQSRWKTEIQSWCVDICVVGFSNTTGHHNHQIIQKSPIRIDEYKCCI